MRRQCVALAHDHQPFEGVEQFAHIAVKGMPRSMSMTSGVRRFLACCPHCVAEGTHVYGGDVFGRSRRGGMVRG
jgi:hypothetical protein